MEIYDRFMKIIDANLIYCLIPMILILILIETFFKNKFSTKKVLNVICWIIISYTVVSLIHFIVKIILNPSYLDTILNRVIEYAKNPFWIIVLLASVLPFTLFIKKMASKFWYVLLVAFFIKAGAYYELYVVLITSMNRDYIIDNGKSEFLIQFATGLSMLILQSLLWIILILGILKIIERNKTQ